MLGAEELLGAPDGQPLNLVDTLAAAVVAPAGVALGVLVGQHRADRGQHRGTGVVLRGDQLDFVDLPPLLALDRHRHLGVVAQELAHAHGTLALPAPPNTPPVASRKHTSPGGSAPPLAAAVYHRVGCSTPAGSAWDERRPAARGPPTGGAYSHTPVRLGALPRREAHLRGLIRIPVRGGGL